MRIDGIEPTMPPLPLPHVFERLMEIGPIDVAGMDRVPIGWTTIVHWRQATAADLSPWEARLLRRLSGEYLTELKRAAAVDCPAPLAVKQTSDNRAAVDRKIAALFG